MKKDIKGWLVEYYWKIDAFTLEFNILLTVRPFMWADDKTFQPFRFTQNILEGLSIYQICNDYNDVTSFMISKKCIKLSILMIV